MDIENKETPLISVIVPVYNAEKTLRECVDSILNQEYKDFELLLVNDGSIDASPSICDEYAAKDERVKVFHKPNGGVSSARNLGLDNAQGEWITFIDSDDYIENGYFVNVEGRTEDILFLGYKTLYKNVIIKDISISEEHLVNSFSDLITANICNSIVRGPVAKFFKKDRLSHLRFNTHMTVGEDVSFVFGYLAECDSYFVLRGAAYVVLYCGIPDEEKYSLTVIKAVSSLMYVKKEFEKMEEKHGIERMLLLFYINYFKRISKSDWQEDYTKWYGNPKIKALYKYVWPSLSLKQKLRLVAARILRR